MSTVKKSKGFTIIEVVLVLAIAGLIFMMVFVALPALQKSQRDTSRKNDVSALVSMVVTYESNNKGAFPPESTNLLATSGGLADYVTAPIFSNNKIVIDTTPAVSYTNVAAELPEGTILIAQNSKCPATASTTLTLVTGSTRNFTVSTWIESGVGSYYCQGN